MVAIENVTNSIGAGFRSAEIHHRDCARRTLALEGVGIDRVPAEPFFPSCALKELCVFQF